MMGFFYYASVFMLGFRGIELKGIKIADLFIVFLFLAMLYRIILKNERLRWNRKFLGLTGLVIAGVLVSLLKVDDFTYAKLDPFRYILVGMFATSIIHYLDSKEKIIKTFKVLLLAGVISAVASLIVFSLWTAGYEGVAPFLHHIETGEAEGRAMPFFYDPNHYGGFLIIPIIVASYFLLTSVDRDDSKNNWLYYLVELVLITALVTTGSRSAVGAVTVAWGAIITFHLITAHWDRLSFETTNRLAKNLILVSLIAAMILLWFGYSQIGKSFEVERYGKVKGGFKTRLQLWSASLIAFGNNPIIGVGTSDFVNEYPRIARRHGFDPETQFFPHNTYIGLLSELGLVGGLSGLLLIAYVFLKGWQNVIRSSGSGLLVILLSLFTAQAAHMFFLSMFHARRLWFVFALIIGASLFIGVETQNKDRGRTLS